MELGWGSAMADYLTFAADAEVRKVVFVTEGRDAKTAEEISRFLTERNGTPKQFAAIINGVRKYLPNSRITSTSSTLLLMPRALSIKCAAWSRKPIPA